jgi:3-oxosteroid 1-dehydrogenase
MLRHVLVAGWVTTKISPGERAFFLVSERSKPGTNVVGPSGSRNMNALKSYEDMVHNMLARHEAVPAIPPWLIFNTAYRDNYLFGFMFSGRTPESVVAAGYFKRANSLRELAALCDIDPAGFAATAQQFSGIARQGVDEDFRRGESVYDRHDGDPQIKLNPNLALIEKSRVNLYPRDAGTKGGLVTDEKAVERRHASPALYASDNTTASVH